MLSFVNHFNDLTPTNPLCDGKGKKKNPLQKHIKGPLVSCADLTKEKWNWVAKNK